jgi:hypothetical protein
LGQHVGDLLGPAGVVATLLALAASGEIGGSVVGLIVVNGCSSIHYTGF